MNSSGPTPTGPDSEEPRRLEREIEALRSQLDELVDELGRRRQDALDWRYQLRRHPVALALGVGAVGAALAFAARRRNRPVSIGEQLATFARGIYAIGEDPRRVERATEPSPALVTQLAKTAALAGASVLVRRITRNALGEQA